jgi:transcriptional regulator with XRE-family HTH domain
MLSQDEVAELLGVTQSRVSRYEKGEEIPTVAVSFALQVLFGRCPTKFFPAFYSGVEEAVMTRAAALERRLADRKDYLSVRKRHHLEGMMARATHHEGHEGR